MRAIEFKTNLRNNRIGIPVAIQAELQIKDKANGWVMILFDDSKDPDEKICKTNEQILDIVLLTSAKRSATFSPAIANDELNSINKGLKDFEEGKFHSNETARQIYGKYL